MKRILALHAHPDDCETLVAGTLARLSARGCAVTIATATAGECGAVDASPDEIGVAYAEGFRQYRHEPYPRTPRLQELLASALRQLP